MATNYPEIHMYTIYCEFYAALFMSNEEHHIIINIQENFKDTKKAIKSTGARGTELHSPLFFLLSVYIFIFNKISLFLYYFNSVSSFYLVLSIFIQSYVNSNLHVSTLIYILISIYIFSPRFFCRPTAFCSTCWSRVGTFLRFVAIGFYFLSETLM